MKYYTSLREDVSHPPRFLEVGGREKKQKLQVSFGILVQKVPHLTSQVEHREISSLKVLP